MALGRTQHHQHRIQIRGLANAFAWQHLDQLLPLLGFPVVVIDLGVDVAGADGVHVDAVFAPLHGHRLGHVHHGRLAHTVDPDLWQHLQPGHRRDVDDAPAHIASWCGTFGARKHALGHFLGHKEGALGVRSHDEVIVFLGHVLQPLRGAHARVVDQDVNRSHFGFRVSNGRLDGGQIGHVEGHNVCIPALRLDFGSQCHQPVGSAARQNHRRAGFGQRLGKLLAQPA